MSLFCVFNLEELVMLQNGTSLQRVFNGYGLIYIVAGYFISLAQSASLLFDLILDFAIDWKADIDDRPERFVTFVLLSVHSALMISLRNDPLLPILFCLGHTIQMLGSVAVVLAICNRAFPTNFNPRKTLTIMVISCVACNTAMMGFGRGIFHWANVITYLLSVLNVYLQIKLTKSWADSTGLWNKSFHSFSIREVYCMSYIAIGFLVIGTVLIVGGFTFCRWTSFDVVNCLSFVFSFVIFSVIATSLPGRTARTAATEEHKVVMWKKTLIRFLSHEIRSPLNIMQCSLESSMDELSSNPTIDPEILNDFNDVRESCTTAVVLLDSMIQMEQIDSGMLTLNLAPSPSDVLEAMAKRCGIITKQKQITLTINNLLREERDSRGIQMLIDQVKMDQVVRNLVVNAVKFTPVGGSVAISIKRADPLQLQTLPSRNEQLLTFMKSEMNSGESMIASDNESALLMAEDNQDIDLTVGAHSPLISQFVKAESCGIVIEVIDSGIGISKENCEEIFGEFYQFKPDELQGGGGSGLGLWVCKSIVQLHGGRISCHSAGIGSGATFRVLLRGYIFNEKFSYGTYQDHGNLLMGRDSDSCTNFTSAFAPISTTSPPPIACKSNDAGTCLSMPYRILVVDDSNLNRKVVCRALENVAKAIAADANCGIFNVPSACSFDIDIIQCEDGIGAVEKIAESVDPTSCATQIDVVIMDNIMVEMHGPDAAFKMRALGYTGLILGLTGMKTDARLLYTSSCSYFLLTFYCFIQEMLWLQMFVSLWMLVPILCLGNL